MSVAHLRPSLDREPQPLEGTGPLGAMSLQPPPPPSIPEPHLLPRGGSRLLRSSPGAQTGKPSEDVERCRFCGFSPLFS